jgi:hypothetical protein
LALQRPPSAFSPRRLEGYAYALAHDCHLIEEVHSSCTVVFRADLEQFWWNYLMTSSGGMGRVVGLEPTATEATTLCSAN